MPRHSHLNPVWCVPDCPVWKAEAIAYKRAVYVLRRHIEESVITWCQQGERWQTLRQLRAIQTAHPNRYPRQ